jgi:hypothetical protein
MPSPPAAYFTQYVIFYRMYISDRDVSGGITDPAYVGNTTLTSHYNTLLPYADETNNISASQVGNVFNSLLYSEMEIGAPLSGPGSPPWPAATMQGLLGSSPGGSTLVIEFSPSLGSDNIPYLILNDGTHDDIHYRLRRNWTPRGFSPPAGAPSVFTPLPASSGTNYYGYTLSRYDFTRKEGLCATANNTSNWDVSVLSGTNWSSGTGQYAYVSLYIIARGIDPNFNLIYSRPTFLGVLRLPD